ncbi:LppX_LprAFG lipoprotein [Serinibacter salmoneus]|uniref:Uncharacterized protein DUF1396 n=1 Tax=Serinibacter salmoneus TaxID=556530 RepID=A0A2A9D283_9MICO|nr:LppX_LprAFG lipoprotein [Serinibacter salmoneus]PFG20828.1 uncharacterized protein DUF1396 [Serinibacter salmoneus]
MRTMWGKFLVTTTATLAVAGLAACSSSETESDTEAGTETSSETSSETETDTGDGAASESGDATEAFIAAYGDGVQAMSSTTQSFTMVMDMGDLGSTDASGVIDYSQDPYTMQMTMAVPGAGEIEMIMLDGGIYMGLGEAAGGGYVFMSADDPSLDGAFEESTMDPIAQLESFTAAVESVEEIGAEEVDGVETTHYNVTVDGASLAETAGQAAGAMPDTITYDIWLDSEGRTVQMTYDIQEPTAVSTTMTFSDFGEAVTIEAPPADEVVDMTEMNAG